jgi:uncharacterized OsmC-like protein
MTTATLDKPAKGPLNGVNTPALLATINAVAGARDLAAFKFRARARWVSGTHSVITVDDFDGAGGSHKRDVPHVHHGDHPVALLGEDNGPTPVEFLLQGLAACLTAGIGNIAAARGVELAEVTALVEGDIDLQGIFGIDDKVRNGYSAIRATFCIRGNAPAEVLRSIVEQSKARSAVFDVLTNGVPIALEIDAA